MNSSRLSLWLMVTLTCVGLAGSTQAQRLYDAKRDEQAQAALKIAADLQSGSLFDKQLKNLALLGKRDMEASLAAARTRMRSDINSFTTWTDVNCVVGRVNRSIAQIDDSATIRQNLSNLATEIGDARANFNELKLKTECKLSAGGAIDLDKCPEMKPGKFADFFDHAENLKDLDDALRSLTDSFGKNKNITGALDRARSVVAALKTLYQNYQARMDEYNRLKGELLDIQLQLKKVALQSMQVEEQHLKNVLKIRARRESEEADIIGMIDDYEAFSDKYRLGFIRNGQPPCAPEDVRPSGHRGIPVISADNIEMSLRDLVAKVRAAENTLDRAKLAMAQQELRRVAPYQAQATAAKREKKRATDEQAKQSAAAKQQQAERTRDSETQTINSGASAARLQELTDYASAIREELSTKLFVLHLAAAISARGHIPSKLAALREAREDHAHSIRKSGVMARAYQLTVSGGVKRLALYHKGGIKPSKIAELIHAAATVAIPPVIANH